MNVIKPFHPRRRTMKKLTVLLAAALLFSGATSALATPSTQIWIPSTDIQAFGSFHLGIDNYVAAEGEGQAPFYVLGLTAGVLPFEKVQAEIGIDYMASGGDPYDDYPLYFNAKVATPEGALFGGSPALAVGGYNFGTESDLTNQNIVYGLIAKTLPVIGRLSVGYFTSNEDVIGDDNSDILASWDRTLSEISPKLWAAVDYQGGDSALGALSFGLSWAFADNVSVIAGYDIFNNSDLNDTFTTQLDINF
jgi:opacity protein-like surface antigen